MKVYHVLPLFLLSESAWAVDSYRYLHVTIDTPWYIFIFLLGAVLSPFVLMAILYWRFSGSKPIEKRPDVKTSESPDL